MKYIIWSYNDGEYINKDGIAIEFETEKEAQNFIEKAYKDYVLNVDEYDSLEEVFLIEEIPGSGAIPNDSLSESFKKSIDSIEKGLK